MGPVQHRPASCWACEFAAADYRPALPTIAIPTLLLYGELDRRSPLSVARDLHDRIPGSTLVVIHDVGHLSNVEAPERFNAEVRRFMQGLDR
jgi:pimeloyl-ACP methyl ester carboxylesterase